MSPLATKLLTTVDIKFFHQNGYLRIPAIFTSAESEKQITELDRLAAEWATIDKRWKGPWRKVYMDDEIEKNASLEAMKQLHYYSQIWLAAITHSKLVSCLSQLMGPDLELHHSVMHTKPPGGQPFPMHQDYPFYAHEDGRYLDVLIHLDDTCHENGEIRFLPSSHKQGALEHIHGTETVPSSPHLPTDKFRIEDSVPVPAKRGDIVVFSYYTIHGSYINQTDQSRRMVRIGYRHPHNKQISEEQLGYMPGIMVSGYRERLSGEDILVP